MKKAFVTGYPIKHSRSPMVHGHWLEKYEIEGSYEKIAVEPQDLQSFVKSLKTEGYAGGNFTIPHKQEIFKLVDEVDEVALNIGAINTIWYEQEVLKGTNTDAYGFENNLTQYVPNWADCAAQQTAIVIGAGGASRAILYTLIQKNYKKIILANRTVSNAEKLAKTLSPTIEPIGLDEITNHLDDAALLVNTSSLGMNETDLLPFMKQDLNPKTILNDIVYTPLETSLLKMGKANNNPTVDGLGMLLHQAIPGFEKWFGKKPEVTAELKSIVEADLIAAAKS